MEIAVKQRLIGALVLVLLAFIFLPILFSRPDVKEPDAANVPLDMPAAPDQKFETHDLPLAAPDTHTPAGGVLGMQQAPAPTAPAVDPNAVATVDQTAVPATNPNAVANAPTTAPVAVVPPAASAPAPAAKPVAALPAPTPVAATGPTEAAGNYAVNVGSFSNLENANALVTRLKSQKLPVMSDKLQIDGKPALRIRIGPYVDRSSAEAARQKVEGVVGESVKVIALDGAEPAPAPAVAVAKPAATPPAPTAPVAAKPAPATNPAAAPSNASSTGFAVQLAAPSVEADAIALRDRARAQGFAAFVQRVETAAGVRFRVRVGPETDRATAEKDRDAVAQKLGITGLVVPHP